MKDLLFSFPNAEKYVFIHENAHLLLMTFPRDEAKFLFLIHRQEGNSLDLHYPGQTYTERVLDEIQNIFFIQITEDSGATKKYVLGSTFHVDAQLYGAYYERSVEMPDVVLFRIDGEAPDQSLNVVEELEYQRVHEAFRTLHEGVLEIDL